MSRELLDLDHTIIELKTKISTDPDPFLIDILNRLMVIRENQQVVQIDRAYRNQNYIPKGGFKGYGVS
jgi:hypothetical protein